MSPSGRLAHKPRTTRIQTRGNCRWRDLPKSLSPSLCLPSSAQGCPALRRRRGCNANKRCICLDQNRNRDWSDLFPAPDAWPARRSGRRANQLRLPDPAIRNRHWRRMSGNRADGRRYTAPSRLCAILPDAGFACAQPCRAQLGSCNSLGSLCGHRFRLSTSGMSRSF